MLLECFDQTVDKSWSCSAVYLTFLFRITYVANCSTMFCSKLYFLRIIFFSDLGSVKSEDSVALPRMDARTAESLVSKWQKIKSQAFGRDHCIEMLPEVRE